MPCPCDGVFFCPLFLLASSKILSKIYIKGAVMYGSCRGYVWDMVLTITNLHVIKVNKWVVKDGSIGFKSGGQQ